MSAPEKLLAFSVPEAARLLGLSREKAYQAVQRKELPAVRVGKRILIPRAALEKFLNVKATRPRSEHGGDTGR